MGIPSVQVRSQPRPRLRPRAAQQPRPVQPVGPPPLEFGDRLSRAEFERRYHAHPEIKKAELIEGVVYMPSSPIRHGKHGQPHSWMTTWLGVYTAATPGVDVGDNSTVRMGFESEVQPDAFLRLEPALGGQSRLTKDGYLEGPPELIVEIASSSAAYDLHAKRRVYERNGVQEYVAVQMYERRLDWFILREGVYETLTPDESGILRSQVFPGLWLQPSVFWAGDLATMLAVLQQGLASPEHAAFVEHLQAQ